MSADWHTGDRAVCVDDRINPTARFDLFTDFIPVKEGTVYLVSDYLERRFANGFYQRLLLSGMHNLYMGIDYGYTPNRFRKLIPACDRAELQEALATPPPANPGTV